MIGENQNYISALILLKKSPWAVEDSRNLAQD
jgi:hypothetical protein